MQLSLNPNININRQTYSSIQKYNYSYIVQSLKKDTFELNNNISFKGIEGLFKKSPNSVPQIQILPKVSNEFVSKTTNQISKFSPVWLRKFRENNYKVILSPTYIDAYRSQKVYDPTIEYFEKQNPKGTLGATYTQGKYGKNFFVFCDKPPASDIYTPNIVNHELSHGIVNITGLDKSDKTLELIGKDVESIIKERKIDKLTPRERQMVSVYFFNENAYLPIDEIIADTYAWNTGCGIYGSGLILDVYNPNLMKNLFPRLSKYLKTV